MPDLLAGILAHSERGGTLPDPLVAAGVRASPRGGYLMPMDLLFGERSVSTDSGSGEVMVEPKRVIVWEDVLRETSRLLPRCTLHTGLHGNAYITVEGVAVPATEVSDEDDATDTQTDVTWSNEKVSPTTVRAAVGVTRRMRQQASNNIADQLRRNLLLSMSLKLESMALTYVAGATGIQSVVSSGDITVANAVNLLYQAEVDGCINGRDEDGLAWVTNPAGALALYSNAVTNRLTDIYNWRSLLGTPVIRKVTLPTGKKLFYGLWRRLHVCLWQDVDIVIDNDSNADTGATVVRLFAEANVVAGNKAAFGVIT